MRQQSVASKVAEFRSSKGLTQRQLAVLSGVSLATVAHLETESDRSPRTETLKALAMALGCKLDDLVPGLRRRRAA
jgi:transcriptional regulator with XRE-family HTH domain